MAPHSQQRSQRMKVVLQLAERAEEAAATTLQSSRQQLQQAEEQLQQIEDYQQHYIQELNAQNGRVSVQTLMNDRQFLQQLTGISATQRQQIEQLQQQEGQCLHNWQLCYQRRQNIENLIERLQQAENLDEEKRLQKQLDELSSLMRPAFNS